MFYSNCIKINGQSIYKIVTKLEIEVRINHHGFLTVCGIVDGTNVVNINEILTLEVQQEDKIISLFQGYIVKAEIQYENQMKYLFLTSISATFKFDIDKKNRSFQNTNMIFGELTRQIAGKGRAIIVPDKARTSIKKLWIQYNETDWEFLKRLAGYLHTVIIPEVTNIFPQCSLGVIKGRMYEIKLDLVDNYSIDLDHETYYQKKNLIKCNTQNFKRVYLKVNKNFNLGDKVRINQDYFIITEKKILLEKGILTFYYLFSTEIAACLWNYGNQALAGTSLKGNVIDRENESVRVHLDIDKDPPKESDILFNYAPLTGNIMYALPEVGTAVSLYFPTAEESEGIAVESFHKKILYPDGSVKCLSTYENKMIKMNQSSLEFKGEEQGQFLKISDRDGIYLDSSSNIYLNAGTSIIIETEGMIYAESEDTLLLSDSKYGDFVELVENNINIHGEEILLSGVTRPKKNRKEISPEDGMDKIGKYVDCILGGIPQKINTSIESVVLGGIPLYCTPQLINYLSDIIGIKEET